MYCASHVGSAQKSCFTPSEVTVFCLKTTASLRKVQFVLKMYKEQNSKSIHNTF